MSGHCDTQEPWPHYLPSSTPPLPPETVGEPGSPCSPSHPRSATGFWAYLRIKPRGWGEPHRHDWVPLLHGPRGENLYADNVLRYRCSRCGEEVEA